MPGLQMHRSGMRACSMDIHVAHGDKPYCKVAQKRSAIPMYNFPMSSSSYHLLLDSKLREF